MQVERPDPEAVASRYGTLQADFDAAADSSARMDVVRRWDELRRGLYTWQSLAQTRFTLDTSDEAAKAEREFNDQFGPRLEGLDVGFMRKLLGVRDEMRDALGEQAVSFWECKVKSFDPRIEELSVQEKKAVADYTELMASAAIPFRGEELNLPALGKYRQDPDRATRREANAARWDWFAGQAERLDEIFGRLVSLRDRMARELGFADFVDMGYQRMQRIDYGRSDVERFRAGVRDHVVPLCATLRDRQRETLGLDTLMFWDEAVHDPRGNPKPAGDHDWMLDQATAMFNEMGSGLGGFFAMMRDHGLLDLETRASKAPGGYCTFFEQWRVPFIFANFNGTKNDVEVFTHEVGHAFQGWSSGELFPNDYRWPTSEACEIHSMGLEFLTWPHMEKFFGDDADRFRKLHLEQSILFLPYGVAVDHFQHRVYENPGASPTERNAMWQEMERTYLPWRDFGDVARLKEGGFWQQQLHIYRYPFYYIDYTLAQVCALQYLTWSERAPADAMESYVALCKRGGSAPFQSLARDAGLKSPFDDGVLESVVDDARKRLMAEG